MCDYEAGNTSFVEAARLSVSWFEDWSSGAYLKVSRKIPGEFDFIMAEMGVKP